LDGQTRGHRHNSNHQELPKDASLAHMIVIRNDLTNLAHIIRELTTTLRKQTHFIKCKFKLAPFQIAKQEPFYYWGITAQMGENRHRKSGFSCSIKQLSQE